MSIVSGLIAKGNKTILCEHTDYSGNFSQITLQILGKVTKDLKCVIKYDSSFKFYYMNENEITYLCIGDKLGDEVAFSFLEDLKSKFLKSYTFDVIQSSYSYQLKDFNGEIQELMKFYEKNPKYSRNGVLLSELNKTKSILAETVENLIERRERVDMIAHKAKNLQGSSVEMRNSVFYY